MEQPASDQLAALFQEAGRPPAAPQRTGHPPRHHLPNLMHKSPEMLQSLCSRRSLVRGKSAKGEIHLRLRTKTIPAMWKRTTVHPPRMLTDMTEIAASITRSAGDGRRKRVAIRPMMVEKMTRRSRLAEEEPAKGMEEDHHTTAAAQRRWRSTPCSTQTGGYH